MAPKRKTPSSPPAPKRASISKPGSLLGRDGLGVYIAQPEAFPASRVIFHSADFVAIHDLYPKSSVHCLLLPRSPKHTLEHPFDAFNDAAFLASVKIEAAKLKHIVATELRRKYGPYSKQDEKREGVLNGEIPWDKEELPEGRDWEKEVMVGVHAHPSMNHLHVHVLSRDRWSECLKHRKHYNSFNTEFFVPLEAFPIDGDGKGRGGKLKEDMRCWRCRKVFGNQFARLKEHLAEEFEEWKKE